MSDKNNKPIKKLIAGTVQVAVWENTRQRDNGEEEVDRTVSVDKRYKDPQGNWQSTGSFRANDIPKAILMLSRAYEFLVATGGEKNDGGEDVQ